MDYSGDAWHGAYWSMLNSTNQVVLSAGPYTSYLPCISWTECYRLLLGPYFGKFDEPMHFIISSDNYTIYNSAQVGRAIHNETVKFGYSHRPSQNPREDTIWCHSIEPVI